MTERERFLKTLRFKKVDRPPFWLEGPWPETLERWYREGLPRDANLPNFFGMPNLELEYIGINLYVNPPFERKVIEEDDEVEVYFDEFGRKARRFKKTETMPEWLEFPVKTPHDLEMILEERLKPTLDGRFPRDWAERLERYRKKDRLEVVLCDGGCYYWFVRSLAGVEVASYLFYDSPNLLHRVFSRIADLCILAMEEVFPKVHIDYVGFGEDIAFKTGPLISPAMFKEFIAPSYKRTVEFAKAHGVDIFWVDSDGDLRQLMPLFLECGVNTFSPMEVAASMDVTLCRRTFGKAARFIGGIDKREVARGKDAIDRELERKVPALLREGGYIPRLDHQTVSADTSLENYRYYLKRLGEIYASAS